jgi:hypothetical protein
MNILEFVIEAMFEIFVHAISELWKASRVFRIAVGIIALIGVLFLARVLPIP